MAELYLHQDKKLPLHIDINSVWLAPFQALVPCIEILKPGTGRVLSFILLKQKCLRLLLVLDSEVLRPFLFSLASLRRERWRLR